MQICHPNVWCHISDTRPELLVLMMWTHKTLFEIRTCGLRAVCHHLNIRFKSLPTPIVEIFSVAFTERHLHRRHRWPITKVLVNTLRPRQNRRHFADDVFKCIFLNENVWIWINIWLKFIPKGPINLIPAFVQIMAWRRPGDKPLSEPMMISLPTHICVTRPQWVDAHFLSRPYLSGLLWCRFTHDILMECIYGYINRIS